MHVSSARELSLQLQQYSPFGFSREIVIRYTKMKGDVDIQNSGYNVFLLCLILSYFKLADVSLATWIKS